MTASREIRALPSQRSATGLDSLVEFYDTYVARAYGLALRVLRGDRVMAEHIVIETFVTVWQSESREGEGETPDLECMLLRRIRQRCLDAVRGRQEALSEEEARLLSTRSPGS